VRTIPQSIETTNKEETMTPTGLIRIIRDHDFKIISFDDGPPLWNRWEIRDRPLLAHEDNYCTLDHVTEDVERAKNIINKAWGEEAMFTPTYVATAFISLLRRLVPFEPTWIPAFELRRRNKFFGCLCNILRLDEKEKKWTLIHWGVGDEKNFTSIDFQVLQDQRTGHYGELSMTSLYQIVDRNVYQKMDLLYAWVFAPSDYPEIFKGY
jgi:hypothetical protein